MTLEYPLHLFQAQSTRQRQETLRGWKGLPELARLDFLLMWEERAEDAACYGFVEEGRLVWEALPLEWYGVRRARRVECL